MATGDASHLKGIELLARLPEWGQMRIGSHDIDSTVPVKRRVVSRSERPACYTNIGVPVTATGADDNLLIYTIKNSRTSPFYIDWFTGQLQVGEKLEYEDASSHNVTEVATDPTSETDEITVTINIGNEDESGKLVMKWKPRSGSNVGFT